MPISRFFQATDLLAFGERLRQHPQYDAADPTDQLFAEQLVLSIFDKTKYWGEQVRDRLPRGQYDYEMRRTWQQGTHFRRYSWARLYLRGRRDKAFYFTLGVDSGETADAHLLAAAELVPAGPALI
jgi:hypothetical protein